MAHIGQEFRFRTARGFSAQTGQIRFLFGAFERDDQIVLVVAQLQHRTRGIVHLLRQIIHVEHVAERNERQRVVDRAAFVERKRDDRRAINDGACETERTAGAHQGGVARERASQNQNDQNLVEAVAMKPEQWRKRRPAEREERVGDRDATQPQPHVLWIGLAPEKCV